MMENQVKLHQLQSLHLLRKPACGTCGKLEGSRKARQNLPSEQKL
ncbi:hypothetical protein MUK42_37367 [Musa troglodytarum]|uniref:Uncharacterized protein n=1 Tax=Musa troglodytarum TaxID=320322 RepID=A0A9E7FP60_9LILI|nr:hypothetical protein MUK42_37367 [Musa troglodytarum]